jgi:hypothetical protein
MYDLPLGLFGGVNSHFQSIILGNVLLRDEQTFFFEWVMEFIRMTSDETPKTILICCLFCYA